MVATNGTQTEYIEGLVARTNANGFTLKGRDGWLNLSKYADPQPVIPAVGTTVRVARDKSGYVRTVAPWTLQGATAAPAPHAAEEPHDRPDKDVQIARMNALTTATAILASGGRTVDTAEVIDVAELLAGWVLR